MIRSLIVASLAAAILSMNACLFDERASANSNLQEIQSILSDLGYAPGPADGNWSEQTEAAAKEYLSLNNFPQGLIFAESSRDDETLLLLLRGSWDDVVEGLSERAELTLQREFGAPVTGVAFSGDGARLATGVADNVVWLWDTETGRLLRKMDGHAGFVTTIAMSPDGKSIASGGYDKTVHIWDAKSGARSRVFTGHSGRVLSVVYSPDGAHVVSGDSHGAIIVWDAETGVRVRTIVAFPQTVQTVAVSPDGTRILAAGGGGRVVVLDIGSGNLVLSLEDHVDGAPSAVYSPDGTRIVSASGDGKIMVWEALSGHLLHTLLGHSSEVRSVAVSPNGRLIASGGLDSNVILWDALTGELLRKFEGHTKGVAQVTFSPDGKLLASGSYDYSARIWVVDASKPARAFSGRKLFVFSAEYSADGRYLVSSDADRMVQLWDVRTGRLVRNFEQLSSFSGSVAISPNSAYLATAEDDGVITLWEMISGRRVRTLSGHEGGVGSVDFSPDSSRIVSGGADKAVRLWDVESGELTKTLEGHTQVVDAVAFSPDGNIIASASRDGSIGIWDSNSSRLLRFLKGHEEGSTNISFSPDGLNLLSGGRDNFGRLWNVQTGRELQTLAGHREFVKAVAFAATGEFVVTGSYDGTLRIWSAVTGKLLRVLDTQSNRVESVAVSPDGRHIASGHWELGLSIWDVQTGKLIAKLVGGKLDSWIALSAEGFFAGEGRVGNGLVAVRGYETFDVDQFHDSLFRPDLVSEVLAGDPNGLVARAAENLSLDALIDTGKPPVIEIISPQPLREAEADAVNVQLQLTDQDGGIGRVEWRVNGTTVGLDENVLERTETEVSTGRTLELARTLLLEPGDNVIEVVAYNAANRIASEPATVSVSWDGVSGAAPPDLHVLAVGVNEYRDTRLRLNYAVPDARAIAEAFRQAGPGLYNEIHVHTLFDEEVTVDGLERMFGTLAGDVSARDVFVFFIAGHGKTVDGRYYFIPQDFRFQNEDSIVTDGIGQNLWQSWLARVQARKSLLLYDTCESGSLTGDRIAERGLGRLTAIDKLTRAMGRTVLSASTDDAPALEGYRGHGVFTYALLEAMADGDSNGNARIEVTELAAFVDDRVPEISEAAFGFTQVPQMRIVGSNFPVGARIAALEGVESVPAAPPIPRVPTHVVLSGGPVRAAADGNAVEVGSVTAGYRISVVAEEGGWARIARDGRMLGYVPVETLIRLQ